MSSNNEYAIQVQDVSKIYKLYDKPIDRLKESLSLTHKNYHKDFFALSDISFNVKKGETVGIIGTNGSGKSTILKIITGVLNRSIQIGKVRKRRASGKSITIGVHRKEEGAYYATPVEYGHGGPAPAPAHPFIRPAYDTRQDEAYEIIRDGLRDAINQL